LDKLALYKNNITDEAAQEIADGLKLNEASCFFLKGGVNNVVLNYRKWKNKFEKSM